MVNDEKNKEEFRYSADYNDIYREVYCSLDKARWQEIGALGCGGRKYLEDVPDMVKDMSDIEKSVLVEEMRDELESSVSPSINSLDVAYHYLRLARFSKIFNTKAYNKDGNELFNKSLGCFNETLKSPKYYGISNLEAMTGYIDNLRKEFGRD
ncbi:MAG: hypothetical protein KJ592_03125 [Nanoarchaeota archaeon]|nr:hypothetical protein [Nanoarchaeota archaeon]